MDGATVLARVGGLRSRLKQAMVVSLCCLMTGCYCDYYSYYDCIRALIEDYCTPFGVSRDTYNACAFIKFVLSFDPDNSFGFIHLDDVFVWMFGADEYNTPTGPFPYASTPKAATTRNVVAYASGPQLATMTGTATKTATGWHFDLKGTNPAAGFSAVETLSMDYTPVPGGPATYKGTLNILPSVDMHGVDYTLTGTQSQSLSASPLFSPGMQHNVALASGEFVQSPAPDLSLGGTPPLLVRRTFGSLIKLNGFSGALGDNWIHNYEIKLVITDPGATVMALGGAAIDFVKSGSSFTLADTQPRPYQLVQSGSNYQFYDPQQNLIYTFSNVGALTKIEDRNGNALTVTPGANGPTQITDGNGRTLTFTYNAQGKLASISDPSGRTVNYAYTGTNLTSFADASGKVTSYTYTNSGGFISLMTQIKRPLGNVPVTNVVDNVGRVTKQTDGVGNNTTFAYLTSPIATNVTDALGNSTKTTHTDALHHDSVTDAAGKTTTITWDAANQPSAVTDRLGNKTTNSYDNASGGLTATTAGDGGTTATAFVTQTQGSFVFFLVSKVTLADGTALSATYDANGNRATVTNASGGVTTYTYDSHGRVLTEKNPLGGTTTNTYNTDGTLATRKSPAGDVTTYGYDSLKRLNKITFADGSIETVTYDALDRVLGTTFGSGGGNSGSTVFDDNGNIKSSGGANGSSTYTYDGNDRAVSRTANGATRSITLDALNRPKTLTNEAGEKLNYTYDAVGRQSSVADNAGATYKFTWNAQGYPQSVTDPLSKVYTFTTDAVGRALSATTPLNEKATAVYNKLGRETTLTSPLGNAAKFTWAANYLSRADLPLGISSTYAYNANSQMTGATDPNGNTWKQTFDSLGRRNSYTDPLGHTTTIQFDNRNRPNAASNSLGGVVFTFDSSGNVTKKSFSDGTTLAYQLAGGGRVTGADNLTLTYDAFNRINNSNGITNTRDAVGRLLTITYATGKTVTYHYNNVGLPDTISDWVNGKIVLTYDAAHRLISIQRSNGTKTTYTRDADGRVIAITETVPGTTYTINLAIDADGNVTSSDRNLPLAPSPAPGVSSYSYDAAEQLGGGVYDAMGRITSDALRKYSWDLASRLTSVTGADGNAQYTYDGLGLRVSRTSGGATENYVWNYAHGMPALAVVRSGSADSRYNIFLPDGTWLYTIAAGNNARSFAHFDEAGSTTFLTDDNGAVSDSYGITAFGESVIHKGSSLNPFTFHGQFGVMQEGNSSLFYMRARYYDSAPGRFLSRDPVSSAEPLEINPYQFAFNNPVTFRDPSGRHSEDGCYDYFSLGYDFARSNEGSRDFLVIPEVRRPVISEFGSSGGDRGGDGGNSGYVAGFSISSKPDSILGSELKFVDTKRVLPSFQNLQVLQLQSRGFEAEGLLGPSTLGPDRP